MRAVSHRSGESGVVLLTTLLVLMMISALMAAFYAAVNSDVRATAIDRDQTQAYAAAHAGLEKLTSDLAQLFEADFSPSSSQILAMANNPPVVSGFEYTAPGGTVGSGYNVAFSRTDAFGNPAPEDPNGSNITAGPYKGLKGIITSTPSPLPRDPPQATQKCGCGASCKQWLCQSFSSACSPKAT